MIQEAKGKRKVLTKYVPHALIKAMLLPGCKTPNKPNNPNQPSNNKSTNGVEHPSQEGDAIRLVIESITVNGKPASNEQREAIVPYTGNPDDIGLIQLQYWSEIKGIPLRLKFWRIGRNFMPNPELILETTPIGILKSKNTLVSP